MIANKKGEEVTILGSRRVGLFGHLIVTAVGHNSRRIRGYRLANLSASDGWDELATAVDNADRARRSNG